MSAASPTLAPSIVVSVLFGLTTIIQGWRYFKFYRTAMFYLTAFSLLRVAEFIARAVWSEKKDSVGPAIVAEVLQVGGLYLAVLALYELFRDWTHKLSGGSGCENLSRWEKGTLIITRAILAVSSSLGVIGATKQYMFTSQGDYDVGVAFRKVSALCFITFLAILFIAVEFYMVTRGQDAARSMGKIVATFHSGMALLMASVAYRIYSAFTDPTDSANTQEWKLYAFSVVEELIYLIVYGVLNIEEIFYGDSPKKRLEDFRILSYVIGKFRRVGEDKQKLSELDTENAVLSDKP